jgi:hypothetical protein
MAQSSRGERQPGVRIVGQAHLGSVVAVGSKLSDARPDQAEIEKGRSRSRPAVEDESHRTRRSIRRFRYEGRVKNLRRASAALVEHVPAVAVQASLPEGRSITCSVTESPGNKASTPGAFCSWPF